MLMPLTWLYKLAACVAVAELDLVERLVGVEFFSAVSVVDGGRRGVAVVDGFGSYAAMVAEVSVSPDGEPKVQRIVVAIDSDVCMCPIELLRDYFTNHRRNL